MAAETAQKVCSFVRIPVKGNHASNQGAEITRTGGTEATVTTASVCRAQGTTSTMNHWAEAGDPLCNGDADETSAFTFHTDRAGWEVRSAILEQCSDDLDYGSFIYRATPDFQINGDIVGNGSGGLEGLDKFGVSVNSLDKIIHPGKIP